MDTAEHDLSAVVIFCDSSNPILRFMRKGFGHVAVILPTSTGVLVLDPRGTGFEITEHVGEAMLSVYDLAGLKNVTAIASRIHKHSTRYKVPSLFTCVETVKRILGVRAWWVLTPYQLYTHLSKQSQG